VGGAGGNDGRSGPAPVTLIVDGERFAVETSAERPGEYHFAWLSGPNEGYGFGTTTSDGGPLDPAQLESSIRSFLAQVDPGTGYLE
jgi:hypothetical protein